MSGKKPCFVISPIGEKDSDTRKRSDQVLKHIIRPAVESCGYEAVRADEIDKPGIITSQVIQRVINDPLVIADLTERNPNVFYELAIRHAIKKPLVQIIKKGEGIPFDVAGTRTIQFDHKDLDSVEEAKNNIIEQIKSLELDSSELETPISVSLGLQQLRQSEKPEERSLADLVSAVSELQNGITKMGENIFNNSQNLFRKEIKALVKEIMLNSEYNINNINNTKNLKKTFKDPFYFRKMMKMLPENEKDPISILMIFSIFRDEIPWLYEIGVNLYRTAKEGNQSKFKKELQTTKNIFKQLYNSEMLNNTNYYNEDVYFILKDVMASLDDFYLTKSSSINKENTVNP